MLTNDTFGWRTCPTCKCLMFSDTTHKCPEKVLAQVDAAIDSIIDAELSTWDKDLKDFWSSSDVKYFQHLLEEE